QIVEADGAELEPAEALEGIAPPRAVVHAVAHGLAELAVAGNVDADLALTPHDGGDGIAEPALEVRLVRCRARLAGAIGLDQLVGARQAPHVRGEDAITAVPHRRALSGRSAASRRAAARPGTAAGHRRN